ncbi:MAG TPA: hypothetical protein VJ939_00870 [Bacteroidales bacterium]|nr:hypothetical protein [Bacteroidales bacterium]
MTTKKGITKHKAGYSLLKKSVKNLKDPEARNHLYVFFVCLLISVFIWLSIKLSKDYQATVFHPVKYVSVPDDKLLTNNPPAEIALKVKGKGTELLSLQFNRPEESIRIDLSEAQLKEKDDGYYVELPTVWFLSQVARQSKYYNNLVDIQPDTLFLEFEDLKFRKVPVKHRLNFKLEQQVWLNDSIVIEPDSVIIAGKVSAVDQINSVLTDRKKLGLLNKPVSIKLGLQGFKQKTLKLEQDSVLVTIPCERYTEAKIKLPVFVNGPDTLNIRTFPQNVEVTYWVSLDNYQRINKGMFRVQANFSSNNNRFLDLEFTRKPVYIQVKSVEPNKVEYILLK